VRKTFKNGGFFAKPSEIYNLNLFLSLPKFLSFIKETRSTREKISTIDKERFVSS